MTQLFIQLPQKFMQVHQIIVEKYLIDSRKLTKSQWKVALEAFDLLATATAQKGTQVYTFRTLYRLLIDKVYADSFLKALPKMHDPERNGMLLQAKITRQIGAQLRQSGWIDVQLAPYSLYLQAYCAFWWDSFAKGYRFEAAVYHDLRQSEIDFWAHDFTQSEQRYTSYDLIVSGWQGDVRTSTYFLTTARTRTLSHAFYITRLWHQQRRKRVWAVAMQPHIWDQIDGDTEVVHLYQVPKRFPEVSMVYSNNRTLIVAEYTVWKTKILGYQEHNNE